MLINEHTSIKDQEDAKKVLFCLVHFIILKPGFNKPKVCLNIQKAFSTQLMSSQQAFFYITYM